MQQNVVILGASDNPDRYSYKAFKSLMNHGHKSFLVSPTIKNLEGTPVVSDLSDIKINVDTLTMYVNSKISSGLKNKILELKPKRVIFNPGSENLELETALKKAGIEVLQACTLVLLATDQFEKKF
ncbi:MAG: CoA-binding protein [Bdellovibrio sp.]|nr:CoA-binding protein [Bdellovibrio sp.]